MTKPDTRRRLMVNQDGDIHEECPDCQGECRPVAPAPTPSTCNDCAVRWSCSLEADGPKFEPCPKHAPTPEPRPCSRLFPHICKVNGPCNGLPKEAPDDNDALKSDAWRDADDEAGTSEIKKMYTTFSKPGETPSAEPDQCPICLAKVKQPQAYLTVSMQKCTHPWHQGEKQSEEIPERLSDYRNLHYPIDNGFCSCGVLCETGTKYREHIKQVREGETPSALGAFDWRISQGIPDTRKYSGTELDKLLETFAEVKLARR